ncbi:hypothetical protein HZS_7392 [Henneguya salminicola]|nr:hypothetical protein HZS_7392 [Henneguya salminicola]
MYILSSYEADSILYATVGTFILAVILGLFACQTRYDFTDWGPYLHIFLIGLMIFGIVVQFLNINLRVCNCCTHSLCLIYDVQLLIGGKKYELNESEYIFGVFILYIDIVTLFLYLLSFSKD